MRKGKLQNFVKRRLRKINNYRTITLWRRVFLVTTAMVSLRIVGMLLLTFIQVGRAFNVTLEKLSTLYLPYEYSPSAKYGLLEDAAEQLSYDPDRQILYSVGHNNIHVINISDVTNMTILYHTSIDGVDVTDVEYCGGFILVTMDNLAYKENGMVIIYRRYNENTRTLDLLHNITVGAVPDMLYPTHDCKTVLVAIEAEPYEQSGTIKDPEGSVAMVKFQDTPTGNYSLKILDFRKFNNQIEDLEERGVRFVYRGANHTLANDIEPEYIGFNNDETKAYICLQENNAIAVVDMETEEITNIHGLGFKDWTEYKIDPSDSDGGINLRPWHIYGMYQPDAIKFVTIAGVGYILSANEGDSKDYSFFSEEGRVSALALSRKFEMNETLRSRQQEDKNLGRLKVATTDGKNATSGEYDTLYSFGGRSFSIWRADDMSLVYDSGGDISYQMSLLNSDFFNNNVEPDKKVTATKDTRSDDKGPETESLEIAEFGDNILILVGNERPGILSLFSIDKTKSSIEPQFQGMFHDIPRTDDTWRNLYTNREVSMLDPEDIRYIPAGKSPNNKPLLVVSGSVSGTVTLLQINVEDLSSHPASKGTSIKAMAYLLSFLFLYMAYII